MYVTYVYLHIMTKLIYYYAKTYPSFFTESSKNKAHSQIFIKVHPNLNPHTSYNIHVVIATNPQPEKIIIIPLRTSVSTVTACLSY